MSGKNYGVLDTIGVVVTNFSTGVLVLDDIAACSSFSSKKRFESPHEGCLYMDDGTRIIWTRSNHVNQARKFTYAAIQHGIPDEVFERYVCNSTKYCDSAADEILYFDNAPDATEIVKRWLGEIREAKYTINQ